jgi:hypothetical protein
MIQELITNTRLVLAFNSGTFSYSQIKPSATNEELFELADAFNSLQVEKPKEVYKVVTRRLTLLA